MPTQASANRPAGRTAGSVDTSVSQIGLHVVALSSAITKEIASEKADISRSLDAFAELVEKGKGNKTEAKALIEHINEAARHTGALILMAESKEGMLPEEHTLDSLNNMIESKMKEIYGDSRHTYRHDLAEVRDMGEYVMDRMMALHEAGFVEGLGAASSIMELENKWFLAKKLDELRLSGLEDRLKMILLEAAKRNGTALDSASSKSTTSSVIQVSGEVIPDSAQTSENSKTKEEQA